MPHVREGHAAGAGAGTGSAATSATTTLPPVRLPLRGAESRRRERSASRLAGAVPPLRCANPGWRALLAAIALSVLGILAIRTTEVPPVHPISGRQSVYLGLGIVVALLAAVPSPRTWREASVPLAVVVVFLLVFVLLPFVPTSIVRPRNGARRWITVFVTDVQPSELAKIAFVLVLAGYLRFRANYRRLSGLVPPFALMFVPVLLVLVEPDLGTSMLFPVALFAMLVAAGARLAHVGAIMAAGGGAVLAVVAISLAAASADPPRHPLLEPHQVERIQGLVHQIRGDTRHRDTINYQSFKAMTLVGAGGPDGLGAERSRVVVRHNRLPEEHNDMIFAVAVNRWGLPGGLGIIGLYLVYAGAVTAVASMSASPFGRLACVGFAAIVSAQMLVNIGMTLGLAPITGMTLPFVSAGGSSLVACFLMTGIVLGIGLRPPPYFARRSFEFDASEDGRF